MSNVIWMIVEKRTGKFFDAKDCCFKNGITFQSFYPSRYDVDQSLSTQIGDTRGKNFIPIEGEVVSFDGRELIVAYESFLEKPPF